MRKISNFILSLLLIPSLVFAAGSATTQPSANVLKAQLASTASGKGAALIGYKAGGAGATARTLLDKSGDVVSVRDYGAVGDGVANDNAAIQAAVTAHVRVILPAGTYLAHRIDIPAGHVLAGEGEASILKRNYYVGATETALTILHDNSQLLNVRIDGNKAAAPSTWGTGTYLVGATGAKVSGVSYVSHKRDGLFAQDSTGFELSDITTSANDRAGIAVVGNCHNFSIRGVESTADGVAGVDLEPDTASSYNSGFVVRDVRVDGTLFSVQGLSDSIINRDGSIENVIAVNGGVVRFNKFVNLAVSGISTDATSEFRVEDSYPTVYGRGSGTFAAVSGAGLVSHAKNMVLEPHFTAQPSLVWTQTLTGAGASIAHVADGEVGKYVARISLSGGAAGEYAFYVSPSITVGADEFVSIGGNLKAIVGRPYIEVQYRQGATVLDTYRAAGGTAASGQWERFLKFSKTPAGCDNVRFLIGGTFANVGNFSGDFDGLFVYRKAFKTEAGEVDKAIKAAKAYDPAALADGAGVQTTVTVTGAALGGKVLAAFSADLQGVTVAAWVSSANTVTVRFQNESGGAVDLAAGVLSVGVTE